MHARTAILLSLSLSAPAFGAGAAPVPPPAPTAAVGVASPSRAYTLSPERREKAVAYARARYRLHFAAFAWSVLVLVAILVLRLGPRFRDRAESVSRRRFAQALVFVPLLVGAQAILELPPALYGHRLERLYEQSVQGWGSWLWDWAKGLFVVLVVAVPLVWLLYAILRRSPRRWWIWFWLALLPILVFLIFAAPLAIDPLFFRFEPLAPKHPDLAAGIERVTARAGQPIPRSRMFEMNASSKYRSLNAYVTGLGASKRVVVWDTTLEKMSIAQTLYVFGHEMGHDVLRHIPKTIAFLWGFLLVLLAASAAILSRAFRRPGGFWGARELSDWASLPILLLMLTVASELSMPVVNGYSRSQEHAADVFGLEAIHGVVPDSSRVAAESFQILGEVSLDDPDPSPFIRFWLYSHPPIADRVRFAAEYDPWAKGERPRYLR